MADAKYPSPPTAAFSLFTSRKTVAFAFSFTSVFVVGFTVLLLLNPASYSSPWLQNFLQTSSNRSHFSSLFSRFLPNSSQSNYSPLPVSQLQDSHFEVPQETERFHGKKDWSLSIEGNSEGPSQISPEGERFGGKNESFSNEVNSGGESKIDSKGNASNTPTVTFSQESNHTLQSSNADITDSPGSSLDVRESGKEWKAGVLEREGVSSNLTLEGSSDGIFEKLRKENFVEVMSHCRIFDGEWVRDDSYPLYAPGSCPHIEESFNCFVNGRPDRGYEKYRWQPNACNLPRLKGKHMLELLRGKRVAFVGDSLSRNMWESLVCILRNSVEDKGNVIEASQSHRHELTAENSYSVSFEDYNCSIEFFRSPFLVREWEMFERNGSKKETLRLDMIDKSSDKYKNADILIFNTGHWWTHDKTSKGKGYYQEGSTIYNRLNVKEAYRKALNTWARWIDTNIDPVRTLVFFRGFAATHFRGGRWNSGGQCDGETEPITNEKYLKKYPSKMRIFESVINGMTTPILYLNVSRMTGFRKDAHPSIYRKQNLTEEERNSPTRIHDCSHWCLPGVPDTWNEMIYAQLLVKHILNEQQPLHQEQLKRRP